MAINYDLLNKTETLIARNNGIGADILEKIRAAALNGEDVDFYLNQINSIIQNSASRARVVSGEQARSEMANQLDLVGQQLNEKSKLDSLRSQFKGEIFGAPTSTLEQALESTAAGELGQLSRALQSQQQDVFQKQLLPLLQQRLQSQGIFDSGAAFALPAAQASNLESQRQGRLLSAGLEASQGLRNLQLGQTTSGFELQRQLQSQQFQMALENERTTLIQQLQKYNSPSGLQSFLGEAIPGAILGGVLAAPTGGLSIAAGAGLGAAGGGLFGLSGRNQKGGGYGGYDPMQYAQLMAALRK